MKPLRHCMIVHAYYPLGEQRVQREAQALVEQGYEVDVIGLRRPDEPLQDWDGKVKIYRVPIGRNKQAGLAGQLREYLAFFLAAFVKVTWLHLKHRYATVQAHNLPDFLVFAALAPKMLGARVILDIHDLMPEFFAARFGGGMDRLPVRLLKLQERLSCAFADHVITVTESWREILISRGVPEEKCSVVMNLPDPKVFRPAAAPRPLPQNGQAHILYHGSIVHRYGLDILLQAFARLHQQFPAARLTIQGAGEYVPELRRQIREMELDDAVHLPGRLIPLEDLVELIQTADLAIVPNRHDIFTDGILPTKLMEYAAMGVPAIATDSSAIRAYFSDLVPLVPEQDPQALAQAIAGAIGDRRRLRQMADDIRQFNARYSWPMEARAYVERVRRLARSGGQAQTQEMREGV